MFHTVTMSVICNKGKNMVNNFMQIYLIFSIQMCNNNLLSVTFYKQNSN